jgi:hypothetical protein
VSKREYNPAHFGSWEFWNREHPEQVDQALAEADRVVAAMAAEAERRRGAARKVEVI